MVASTAMAQQQAPQKLTITMVRLMDGDRDGRITGDEFDCSSRDTELFERFDFTNDGVLSAQEIRVGIRVRARIVN
jgi:Ca2+-binding EF-hand superfamily protein